MSAQFVPQNLEYYAAQSPAFSLLSSQRSVSRIRKTSHFEFRCVGKEYGLFRKQAVSYTHSWIRTSTIRPILDHSVSHGGPTASCLRLVTEPQLALKRMPA